MNVFNQALCEERHKNIEVDMNDLKMGLQKVSNRFIVFLTLLSLNLLGVIGILVVTLLRQASQP